MEEGVTHVFMDVETARAYAEAASQAYGRTVFINERAEWPVYTTDYATRYTIYVSIPEVAQ